MKCFSDLPVISGKPSLPVRGAWVEMRAIDLSSA